jgi:hypothetical protein
MVMTKKMNRNISVSITKVTSRAARYCNASVRTTQQQIRNKIYDGIVNGGLTTPRKTQKYPYV